MTCQSTTCKPELINLIHKTVEGVKDNLVDDLKEERDKAAAELKQERSSIYTYINGKCKEWSDKLDNNRVEAQRICSEAITKLEKMIPQKAITMGGLLTSLAVTIAAVGVITSVGIAWTKNTNDKLNTASEKRLSAIEQKNEKQDEKDIEFTKAIAAFTQAIEGLNTTTEGLQREVNRLNESRIRSENRTNP